MIEREKRVATAGALASVAQAAGTFGALAASLLYVRGHIDQLLAAVARVSPMPAMRMDVIAWRTQPPTQWRSYCIALAFAAGASVVHAGVIRALRRWPLAVLGVELAVVAAATAMAFGASRFLGQAFLIGLVPAAVLFAPFVAPATIVGRTFPGALRIAIALQALPLAWGVWCTTFQDPAGAVVGAQLATWAFVVWRGTQRGREEDEALAGLPFTALPMVGLLRSPGVGWVVTAFVLYAGLRLALRSGFAEVRRRAVDVATVAAYWGVCSVVTLPYRFRDLPKINYNGHDAIAFASVASILQGRLMMADAGLVYGPLRSYVLGLYTLLAGVNGEQIRLGQVVLNQIALAAVLAVGWRLVERRVVAMAWCAYLLLVGTFLLDWMNYSGYGTNTFGWVDVGRIGWPMVGTVGIARAVVACAERWEVDARARRRLAGWGVVATLSTLWAQEFGACTLVVLAVLPFAHVLLTGGPVRDRARWVGVVTGWLGAGALGALALYLGVYALRGRAGLFLHTVTAQGAAFTSGSYGALPYPATESTFLDLGPLTMPLSLYGTPLEFALAPAVYFVTLAALAPRAFGRRWTGGDTLTLAVVAFGVTSFRFALGRSDFLHLATCTLPAVLLVPRLVVAGAGAVYASGVVTTLLRGATAAVGVALAYTSLNMTGVTLGFIPRFNGILAGTERPSSGAPYTYSFPRGGDIKIAPESVALIEAIRAHSAPNEKLFQHLGYVEGTDLYFFADRENPTRFDNLGDFLTTDRQVEALEELERDPPKLVVGDDWGMTGDAVNRFLKERYRGIGKFGSWELFERID